ncbi:hypothetical protein [Thalassospira mesophila]|uniref:Yip1 domain-containing protein n=1 Tax=Thalassospira mesophila TaxID=1293891 RepID=A0A1Y2KXD0_9PROT|nr:hypothetical protein [Thalassospira mesophila]OSQ37008.1 hypothetical protein TMES_16300 [Thalassospira mesophila]
MTIATETLRALYGTWRIAHGDARGAGYFTFTQQGFWRSFIAAALVFPAFALLRWHDLGSAPDNFPAGRYLTIETIAYVIKWVAFPLIMHNVVTLLERPSRYIPFITVYNWSSVLQMAVYLLALLLGAAFPGLGAGGFALVAVIAMMVYSGYIVVLMLAVPLFTAIAIVLLDFLLSMTITIIGVRLAMHQLF